MVKIVEISCCFSSLLQEVFLRVLQFSPLLKNQHFQIPNWSRTHGYVSPSSYEILSDTWETNYNIITIEWVDFQLNYWSCLNLLCYTVEPRYNEHLYKEVLGITNNLFCPSNGKIYEKGPRYSEHILPFPLLFNKSRFRCIAA